MKDSCQNKQIFYIKCRILLVGFPHRFTMKSESVIMISGIIMVFSGFTLFNYFENMSNLDPLSRYTQHGGMFVGLLGIGVTIAGILLRLMRREESSIQENFDKEITGE